MIPNSITTILGKETIHDYIMNHMNITALYDAVFETTDMLNSWNIIYYNPINMQTYDDIMHHTDDKTWLIGQLYSNISQLQSHFNRARMNNMTHYNPAHKNYYENVYKQALQKHYDKYITVRGNTHNNTDSIAERLVNSGINADDKHAYIIGGVPGAGKTRAISRISANHHAMPIIGDSYRKYDYDYMNLLLRNPRIMPKETSDTEKRIINDMRSFAYDSNADYIIEGTFRTSEVPLNEIKQAVKHDYTDITAIIIVDNMNVSIMNSIMRYMILRAFGIPARFTPADAQNQTISNIKKTMTDILNQDNINVNMTLINSNTLESYKITSNHNSHDADYILRAFNLIINQHNSMNDDYMQSSNDFIHELSEAYSDDETADYMLASDYDVMMEYEAKSDIIINDYMSK